MAHTFDEWIIELQRIQKELGGFEHAVLEEWGTEVVNEAKNNIIGRTTPLPAVGEYSAWEPLMDSTIQAKARAGLGMGGDPYTMLYASGEMYDSLQSEVDGKVSRAGTDVPYAPVQEYGSITVPPRPFLGPAAYRVTLRLYTKTQKKFKRFLEGR